MIEPPVLRKVLPWYFQREIYKWITQSFAHYSQQKNYILKMEERPKEAPGYVDMEKKVLFVNGHTVLSKENLKQTLEHYLKGLIIHEAGHILFTRISAQDFKEVIDQDHQQHPELEPIHHKTLHNLWNGLEDERIERLLIQKYSEARHALSYIGSLIYHAAQPAPTALSGTLAWRHEHKFQSGHWKIVSSEEAVQWHKVRPLVEQSWIAPSSRETLELAAQIYRILNLTPQGNEAFEELASQITEGAFGHLLESDREKHSDTAKENQNKDKKDQNQNSDQKNKAGKKNEDQKNEQKEEEGVVFKRVNTSSLLPFPKLDQPYSDDPQIRIHAQRIAPLLFKESQTQRRFHHSKGRLNVRRLIEERTPFERKVKENAEELIIHLLIDTSGSMEGDPLKMAKGQAITLLRAASLSHSRIFISSFDEQACKIIDKSTTFEKAQEKIEKLKCGGGTLLYPALELLPPATREKELVIILCDGGLIPADLKRCQQILEQFPQSRHVLPQLIGDALEHQKEWERIFGKAVLCQSPQAMQEQLIAALEAL